MYIFLLIEILAEGLEVGFVADEAMPYRAEETGSIADELNKCSEDGEEADLQAATLDR